MARAFNYEIAFVTELLVDPADERLDHATEAVPNLAAASFGDFTVLTALVEGSDIVHAGLQTAKSIEASGIRVVRTYQDLVTRNDVADRLDVTRQAVGNWVRGDRHDDTPFPSPVSLVAGGVWLWGDVVTWARSCGYQVDEVAFPSLEDHNRLDLLISGGVQSVTVSTYSSTVDIAFRHPGERTTVQTGVYQRSYALAS